MLAALRRKDAGFMTRALLRASADASLIKSIPATTFSEIFRLLDPDRLIEPHKEVHHDLSPAYARLIRAQPITEVFEKFVGTVRRVVQLRREGGSPLGIGDYNFLLKCARAVGDGTAAEALWEDMGRDGVAPDTASYNHRMSARCWSSAYDPRRRQKLHLRPEVPGRKGVKDEVMALYEDMMSRGVAPDERTFSLMMTAMAREGDMPGVKSIFAQVWNVDVDVIIGGEEVEVKRYPKDSPLHPTTDMLFTIAHVFGSNNDIPTALRLVDFVSRNYELTIPTEVWAHLLEWTFVLSAQRPRTLPLAAMQSLWETLIAPPYEIEPTIPMYNRYIKNLVLREMPFEALKIARRGLALYEASSAADAAEARHAMATYRAQAGEVPGALRRESELRELVWARDHAFVKRWARLLLGARPSVSGREEWVGRALPGVVRDFEAFLPERVEYGTGEGGGRVRFWAREKREKKDPEKGVGRQEEDAA
ncbi:MAG: hypothetical protein M1832_004257 [Thelocarpon impressellum]|nr:MAG: hypothetical protein M1832_004257 [Thelocarpon impressellum]